MQTPEALQTEDGPREAMDDDVVVGVGPAGLSTAIRPKQRAAAKGSEISEFSEFSVMALGAGRWALGAGRSGEVVKWLGEQAEAPVQHPERRVTSVEQCMDCQAIPKPDLGEPE